MDPALYRTVTTGVPPFWAAKYARESSKNWDKFYRRNKTNFYRDRHWTATASTDGFPCLTQAPIPPNNHVVLLEAGCGVANAAFPLLSVNPSLFIYAFDFAPSAIQLIRQNPQYDSSRCHAFVWDFCKQPLSEVDFSDTDNVQPSCIDFCTLIFVLSAVPPDQQLTGLRHLAHLLKPGGKLLFRDYAEGDLAQDRFASRSRIARNYFVRQDGTLSYFFDENHLHTLLSDAGLEKESMRRVKRTVINRKEKLEMERVFLQAVYVKPHAT